MKYSDEFQPGDTLGKYEIVREIATGGMATIYLARVRGTAGFEKNVVLKCILPSLAEDSGFIAMFLDEARLAATLRHSNIADVFDVGKEDNTYFFAMEYVHGQNARAVRLESKQRVFPIPSEVSLTIIAGTAAALGYAHTRAGSDGPLGIVHRDVSPSNILVSYEGAIKLVDFGIARATARPKTRTGMRKGKVPYMSPEQCRGQTLDGRSDLFSLGTVMYELTTGVRPFQGNSDFEVMDQIVTCEPEPPSIFMRNYPPKLEAIVMRLLARLPQARYQTAGELLETLEGLIAKSGMLMSAQVVAKYMRELFAESSTAPVERDTHTDFRTGSGSQTREYPDRRPPTSVMATLTRAAEEEPTEAFRRAEQLVWTPELKVKVRTPKRMSTDSVLALGDEPSSPFNESTRQDVVLPFDPIDARSVEILEHLDDDAPEEESPDARTQRRIQTLLDQSLAWLAVGELDKAVSSIELALDEDTESTEAQQLLQNNVATLVTVYEAMLEDPYRKPALTRSIDELDLVAMEAGARRLLPWIDGRATIKEILDGSGMQRLEAYHHLCQLLLRGVLT